MNLLQLDGVTVKETGKTVLHNLSFTIRQGEQWAITGPSGSGKTTLLHTIAGLHAFSGSMVINTGSTDRQAALVLVEQQHRFRNLSNTSNFYYQQRFNSADSEDAVTVAEYLEPGIAAFESRQPAASGEAAGILALLHVDKLLPVKLIQLSNGENKRLQIAKALLLQPAVLLLDNPFTGLDADARDVLARLLQGLTEKGIHLIMTTTLQQVPPFITHVLQLEHNGQYHAEGIEAFHSRQARAVHEHAFTPDGALLQALTRDQPAADFAFAVRMKGVTIRYNNRTILDDVDWEVRRGEHWALSGPNGAGKSTLLSLINADNPQAYANEIYLFDRRRGTGESIWDIKKRIGFVSPELHLYFDATINCFDVVASGLFDTIGLFRLLNEVQASLVLSWMKLLHIDHLRNTFLFQLSNSEQRLVLLARALVKNPPVLILDEPCQGLDDEQVALFRSMVNTICTTAGKTLIYVSHYREELPGCIDHFFRLENGRRVEEGG